MDRLSLSLKLREALWEISQTGGDPSLHVQKNYLNLNLLREYFFKLCRGKNVPHGRHGNNQSMLDDLLERDRFERKIAFCTVRLRDFGVPEELHEDFLKRSIERTVDTILTHPDFPEQEISDALPHEFEDVEFEEVLVSKLAECFRPWYYPTVALVYEILEEHMFSIWDFKAQRWQLTNLGRFGLQLHTFSLLAFLLSIEINFTKQFHSNRYPNEGALRGLLGDKEAEDVSHSRRYRAIALRWYGIVDRSSRHRDELTDFGRQLIRHVLKNKDSMKDLILMLVESGDKGVEVAVDDSIIKKAFGESTETSVLTADQKKTLDHILSTYQRGECLDSLRLFYPVIEGVIDSEIQRHKFQVSQKAGMGTKLAELVKHQVISKKLGSWGEIVNSRNKIVHGNLMDNDQELLKPLFLIVSNFWYQFLSEISPGTRSTSGNL